VFHAADIALDVGRVHFPLHAPWIRLNITMPAVRQTHRFRPARFLVVFPAASMLLYSAACKNADQPAPPPSEADKQRQHVEEVVRAGGVVDSILPMEEQVRRFREGMTPVDTLRHSSASREALVERLARAIARRDTADLNAMVLDRAEFAFLYYPESAMSRPPYEAPPTLLWGQILASSNAGAEKLLVRLGGKSVRVTALQCPAPDREGANQLYQRCSVRFASPDGASLEGQLFGSILERDGRFKFVGLANRI
jgi:hypothetical protein